MKNSGGGRPAAVAVTALCLGLAAFAVGSRAGQDPVEQAGSQPPVDSLAEDLGTVVPFGLPDEIPEPAGNEFQPGRFALGRRLFFDPILSADRSVSCASCHRPQNGFAHPDPLAPGVFGRHCGRNAPTLFNRAFAEFQMWDGRATSLEQQVLFPIFNPDEMDLKLEDAVQRLREDASYVSAFGDAYGAEPSEELLAFALAQFVRRLFLADSPIDRFRAAQLRLDRDVRQGLWIFESRGACWKCHSGPNFSDEKFHNTGVGVVDEEPRPGRFAITANAEDFGRFKTPTLRGLVHTGPYMHDGSIATLEEVVRFYQHHGNANGNLDPALASIQLSDEDVQHLVAFLHALSEVVDPATLPAATGEADGR